MLQQLDLNCAVGAGDSDVLTEVSQGLGRYAAPPLTGQRWHARVVPAVYVAFLNKPHEAPLAGHNVGELQLGELDLARMVDAQGLQVPVVQGAVVQVLKRTERMSNAFNRV